jgi:hypothetical protein
MIRSSLALLATLAVVACGEATVLTPSPAGPSASAIAGPSAATSPFATAGSTGAATPAASGDPTPDPSAGASGAPSPGASVAESPIPTVAGSTGSPGASAGPSSAPATPRPTPRGTPKPIASGDLTDYDDLRDLVPDTVGGITLAKSLTTGEQFAAFPQSVSEQFRAMLKGLGRDVTDLQMAVANDPTGGEDITITAFRVRDVQADAFFKVYVPLIKASLPNAAVNETVLGGKTVFDVSLDGTSVGTTFLYPRDDVLFIVTGTDFELVDMAFAVLP